MEINDDPYNKAAMHDQPNNSTLCSNKKKSGFAFTSKLCIVLILQAHKMY